MTSSASNSSLIDPHEQVAHHPFPPRIAAPSFDWSLMQSTTLKLAENLLHLSDTLPKHLFV